MFETFMGKSYADSPKYIYEYLAKNYPGKYKFIWVLNDPKEKLPYEGKIVKRFTREYAYYLGVSKYFVFNIRQPLWFRMVTCWKQDIQEMIYYRYQTVMQ